MKPRAAPEPCQNLDIRQVAELVGVSEATIRRLCADEAMPLPARSRRRVLWLREEIVAWIAAKMPRLREWERSRRASSPGTPLALPVGRG